MENNELFKSEIDKIINSAFVGTIQSEDFTLKSMFEKKLNTLQITPNQAVENLQIEYRTLYGILEGSLKRLDILSLLKIAQFLEIPYAEIVDIYIKSVTDKHKEDLAESKRRAFILNNFDLPVLKSLGIIESTRDFSHIESRLNSLLELNSILEYDLSDIGAVYSSGKIIPKKLHTREFFIKKALLIFKAIKNSNTYEKERLIECLPRIRFHSMDVENGLIEVIQLLFETGITVIFLPKMPLLQIRGATFAVNNKPCIVLTDFKGNYPTLWFALIHELFHVLFDWDDIVKKKYHISDEEDNISIVQQREDEANEFAREFLFSKKKIEIVSNFINDRIAVRDFALQNHVHPSIIYANFAFLNHNTKEENYWAKFKKFMPVMDNLLTKLGQDLGHNISISKYAKFYLENVIKNR